MQHTYISKQEMGGSIILECWNLHQFPLARFQGSLLPKWLWICSKINEPMPVSTLPQMVQSHERIFGDWRSRGVWAEKRVTVSVMNRLLSREIWSKDIFEIVSLEMFYYVLLTPSPPPSLPLFPHAHTHSPPPPPLPPPPDYRLYALCQYLQNYTQVWNTVVYYSMQPTTVCNAL